MSQLKADESVAPLVFVHGSGDSAKSWALVIATLTDIPCVALDLPGHGALIEQPGPYAMSVSDYAAFVRMEIERRKLTDARIVGHSLGGAIALQLALDAPDLVGGIALVGTGARLRVLPDLLAAAQTEQAAAQPQLTGFGFAPGHEEQRDRFLREMEPVASGTLYRDLAACDTFDRRDQLERITCPALIVVGTEDRLTPPKYATYLYDHLSQATLVEIAGAGHYLQQEAPEDLAEALRDWRTQTLG
ncbi:MAG TPA: alpha/beta hydrolase [Ktedonobacterales bacterium]|jgi:pimeloyl-ACP methyl ester carboxylesterase|nr:alpha/beta hydrolase [Ktedonobacterales bacterium]